MGSTRSTITVKSVDTDVPKRSRRSTALDMVLYFAGTDPRRVKSVRRNEIHTEWDDEWRDPTTRHQLYFVSSKNYYDYGWGYEDVYEPAPRRSESRRSNHSHRGGPPPRPMGPMGGMGGHGPPPGPMNMGRDDDYSSGSSDDGSYSDDSADEYGMPPPGAMGVGPEFGDGPFGPPPHMMGGPPMMHQGHFAGPPPPPPAPGGDAPAFFKIN